jgi:uncharacterized membrane protein YqiK
MEDDARFGGGGQKFDSSTMPMWITIIATVAIFVFVGFWALKEGLIIVSGDQEFVCLIQKTGKNLSNSQIFSTSPEMMGPKEEIILQGWHWKNPWAWEWSKPMKATEIAPGHVGVLVRQFGEELPEGQIIATNDSQKGILAKVLMPGRHFINTWAYAVEQHPMVSIPAGYVGIVTVLVGKEPTNSFTFVVNDGERGTQKNLLGAGTFPDYSNPYIYTVTRIEIKSQKFEMSGDNAITFFSKDGFEITIEAVCEWALVQDKIPLTYVTYGDQKIPQDDVKKVGGIYSVQDIVLLPYSRSHGRIIGSEHPAIDYITGQTKQRFQDEVEARMKENALNDGVVVKSWVIKNVIPPQAMQDQYSRREVASRQIDRYRQEITTQIGSIVLEGAKPKLDNDGKQILDGQGLVVMEGGTSKIGQDGKPVREGGNLQKKLKERAQDREIQLGEVRKLVATEVRSAEQYSNVQLRQAERDVEVAKINLRASEDTAAATVAEGTAKADVVVMNNQAKAAGVKAKVTAFGDGSRFAENKLITKLGPGITRILSNTEGTFAEMFQRFSEGTKPEQQK